VKFWDSSALVPLFVDEPTTDSIRALMAEDTEVAVWLFTVVELLSAIGRLDRQSTGLDDLIAGVRTDIRDREAEWTLVTHVEAVRRRAERLVGLHPLTAADAMQLAAAQVLSNDRPDTLPFVTLDTVLARAARLEGFRVLTG
jgi:predicted nucleic acid-binding protein